MLVCACFIPAIEIAIEAFIGAGNEQRGFRYTREVSLALDGGWPGPFMVVLGLALFGSAAAGLLLGSRRPLVVAAFVLAVGLGVLAYDTADRLDWAGPGGVIGYEEPAGGPLLQDAIDDLKDEARASPEAREPGWELLGGEHGFSSRGLVPWRVVLWSSIVLLWLTGYRLARLAVRPWAGVLLVVAGTGAVVVVLVLRGLSRLE